VRIVLPRLCLSRMLLARYQCQAAAFVGATRYRLVPHLEQLQFEHPDRRRVEVVCELAVEYRRLTGTEMGREPQHPE
jgi:hypothetical protein